MKKENIKLIKLFETVINEVGDLKNIPNYDYTLTNGGGRFQFDFENKKYKCKVEFTQVPTDINSSFILPPVINHNNKEIVNISFDVEGHDTQYLQTNYKILLGILKTVTSIINDSLSKYSDDTIFVIFAASKKGIGFNDPQKMKLYKLVLQKNVPNGYRIGDGTFMKNKLIFLTKA